MTNQSNNLEKKSISSVYDLFDYIIKGTEESKGIMKRSGAIILLMCLVGLIISIFLETEEMAIVFPVVGEIVKYGLGVGLILFLFSLIGEGKAIEKKEEEKLESQEVIDYINKIMNLDLKIVSESPSLGYSLKDKGEGKNFAYLQLPSSGIVRFGLAKSDITKSIYEKNQTEINDKKNKRISISFRTNDDTQPDVIKYKLKDKNEATINEEVANVLSKHYKSISSNS